MLDGDTLTQDIAGNKGFKLCCDEYTIFGEGALVGKTLFYLGFSNQHLYTKVFELVVTTYVDFGHKDLHFTLINDGLKEF